MQPPTLVRRRGEAASEQKLFVLAQTAHVADFFEHLCGFFLHVESLLPPPLGVESDLRHFSLFRRGGGLRGLL